MKFTIITHAIHKQQNNAVYAYEPYVREMNLWGKYVDEIKIVAPVSKQSILNIESQYLNQNIKIQKVNVFNIKSIGSVLKTILMLPKLLYDVYVAMKWADHIHLRCPGNMGLLGCFVQILFPKKNKTTKYAGNWDPKAKQPWAYKLQKKILSNTFLTKNMTVMVYGKWEDQTRNIKPFFTATYTETDKKSVIKRNFKDTLDFVFIGSLSKGKQPLFCVKVIEKLYKSGKKVRLTIYGEGEQRIILENYIKENRLEGYVFLLGNHPKNVVKKALQKAHFMILPSKSEGWPKVVAEAMFWGCLPIVTKISCVPYMLSNGLRGILIDPNIEDAVKNINDNLQNESLYQEKVEKAISWSRNYTLDIFEEEIAKLLQN